MVYNSGLLASAIALALYSSSCGAAEPLLIYGGQGHQDFLGCLNCSEISSESVWNSISTYGWSNDIGKWSPIGNYASPIATHSACNELASDPPVIVDRAGRLYGRLSINELAAASVCGISGSESICRSLRLMCRSK